ncbi:hypothetical protein QBC40DRAFT_331022 [Triangularia verruculosa]|uniref:Uncharacterized protein n=1 Tax=Triangularia verruculosa TaxID=2587418 RepID=A0AAN6XQC1_9PEZI|nr:hypothetical protein QBC40DRAFT_331022 [Triangularia verruculosa]
MAFSSHNPFPPARLKVPDTDTLELDDDQRSVDEEGNDDHQSVSTREKSFCSPSAVRITILTFAIWGLVSLLSQVSQALRPIPKPQGCLQQHPSALEPRPDVYHPETLRPGLNLCDCGSNIKEALSLGCVYDTLATAWMPPYCRDPELTAEFDLSGSNPDGSWPYYADKEGKVPLSVSEVAALGGTHKTFWAPRRWHIVHCLFYWQKYWRMRQTGAVMEDRYDRLTHVRHCIRLILNPEPDHFFLIEVPVTMNSSIFARRTNVGENGKHHDHHPVY